MTPQERVVRFQKLRDEHPDWTTRFISGILAGMSAAEYLGRPEAEFREGRCQGQYALGYRVGFAFDKGVDVCSPVWCTRRIQRLAEQLVQ